MARPKAPHVVGATPSTLVLKREEFLPDFWDNIRKQVRIEKTRKSFSEYSPEQAALMIETLQTVAARNGQVA